MKVKETVINDEGTQVDINKVDMFDQTTLYTLNANTDNKRYSFSFLDVLIQKLIFFIILLLLVDF